MADDEWAARLRQRIWNAPLRPIEPCCPPPPEGLITRLREWLERARRGRRRYVKLKEL